jgi:sterol desaturase/sphingolipid hydroxylase (fatty acid hydroxylase superfamily)
MAPSLSTLWGSVLDKWPYGDRWLFTALVCGAHTVPYVVANIIYYAMSKSGKFERWRVNKDTKRYPSTSLMTRTIVEEVIGHLITTPAFVYLMYPLWQRCGMSMSRELPSPLKVAGQFLLGIFVNDSLFFWIHRALHTPWLYKHIHKKHHDYRVSVGIAAEYAHPLEEVVANALPTLASTFLVPTHALVIAAWMAFRVDETVVAHCGLEVPHPWNHPLLQVTRRHDYHHSQNVDSYGSMFCLWDRALGTDAFFRAAQRKRAEGGAEVAPDSPTAERAPVPALH